MSAIFPLNVAIDTAIQGDTTLARKLRGEKVYSLVRPALDSSLPCIILGQSAESPERLFGSKGHQGTETIEVFSNDVTKVETAGIVADLERLLDGTRLVVAGHYFCSGSFACIALTLDPSGKYAHAVCKYEALTYG